MTFHDTPKLPPGFSCMSMNCGLKANGAPDLALFYSDIECTSAAVFTRNHCCGAPITVGRELMKDGRLQAIVVNSKISNVGTGLAGVEAARRMGAAAATALNVPVNRVLMSSTGIILRPLPIERIEAALNDAPAQLQANPLVGVAGMMTTDTYAKALSVDVGSATITVVGKGSGMISPNMATMLVYIFTDAEFEHSTLQAMLEAAVNRSFNMLSVDTDTSTSDTCAIMASGRSGTVEHDQFQQALDAGCIRMAEMLARDGEGASKLLRVTITGATSDADARVVAKAVVDSPLIKTMAYGGDPNIGRILMAIGKCVDANVSVADVVIRINGELVYANQAKAAFDDEQIRQLLEGDPVDLEVRINTGDKTATAYGCDLTDGYIAENAAKYSS